LLLHAADLPDAAVVEDLTGDGDPPSSGQRPGGQAVDDAERPRQAGRRTGDLARVDAHRDRRLDDRVARLHLHTEHRTDLAVLGPGGPEGELDVTVLVRLAVAVDVTPHRELDRVPGAAVRQLLGDV